MGPLRLGALAALAIVLYGQSKPKDVDGWDKIKWGMTIAEARSAYGIDAQPESTDDWMLLKLKPVKLAGVELGVEVGARSGAKAISMLRMWSYFGLPTSAPGAREQDFDTLRGVLIEKYGEPANEETKHGENFRLIKTVQWTFPSTAIAMTLEESTSIPNIGNITLDFTATGR